MVREIAGRPCVNGSWCCRMRVAPRPDVEEVDRGFGAQTAQRSNPRYHHETPTVSLPRWSSCVSKSLPLSAGWGPIQPRNRTAGQVRDSGHACFSAFCLFLTTRKIVKTAINKCTGRCGKRETNPHTGQSLAVGHRVHTPKQTQLCDNLEARCVSSAASCTGQ